MKAIFGKKEGKGSSTGNPSLPKPPTNREMLEDIENIKKTDPILSLASVLDTTGRHSLVDTDLFDYIDAWNRRKRRESASSSTANVPKPGTGNSLKRKYSTSTSRIRKDPGNSAIAGHKSLDSFSAGKAGEGAAVNQDSPAISHLTTEEESNQTQLNYDKIKHFLSTLEYSEEVIDAIDSEFARLFGDIDGLPLFRKARQGVTNESLA